MSAAEVLAKHRKLWSDGVASCAGCDWTGFGTLTRTDLSHAAHQLDALKAAGYEVVELPKPHENWDGSLTAWPVTQHWSGRPDRDGEVSIRPSDGRISATSVSNPCSCAEDARSLAAALLAAANSAEATS